MHARQDTEGKTLLEMGRSCCYLDERFKWEERGKEGQKEGQ